MGRPQPPARTGGRVAGGIALRLKRLHYDTGKTLSDPKHCPGRR
jgi:hypothetical protein